MGFVIRGVSVKYRQRERAPSVSGAGALPADTLERIKQAYLERGGLRDIDAHGWVRPA
jgi:hypothetical protein